MYFMKHFCFPCFKTISSPLRPFFYKSNPTFKYKKEIFPTEIRTMCHGISAAFGKVGALVAAIIFNYTNDVQIFMISGYTAMVALIITVCFIPETTQLDLFELDRKWRAIVEGRRMDYRGQADDVLHSSMYERRFGI